MEDIIFWLEELTKPNSAEQTMITLTIISITISSLALIFAIFIPVRISKRQDKIALFEKRYEIYQQLLECINIAECQTLAVNVFKNCKDKSIASSLATYFDNNLKYKSPNHQHVFGVDENGIIEKREEFINYIGSYIYEKFECSTKSELLFTNDFSDQIAKLIQMNLNTFLVITNDSIVDNNFKEIKKQIKELETEVTLFKNNVLVNIEKEIKL